MYTTEISAPEKVGPEEDPTNQRGVIWFDNIFPYSMPIFDPRAAWLKRYSGSFMSNARYEQFIPTEFPSGSTFKIISAEENLKEGGIYLTFKYRGGSVEEAVETIQDHVRKMNSKRLFKMNFLTVRAFQVKGTPWVEDLVSRVPTTKLHVEFHGPDLTIEELYREFRIFGRIMDIKLQPSTDKELPRYASVNFLSKRYATSARNCIHGEKFGDTVLMIGYERTSSWWKRLWNAFSSNLRISAVLLLGVFGIASFVLFEPWREFSVTNRITGRFNRVYKNLVARLVDTVKAMVDRVAGTEISVKSKNETMKSQDWSAREQKQLELAGNLKQVPTYPVLIQGPRGSGKTKFIKDVIEENNFTLYIDCEELVGKGDYYLHRNLCNQVNYFPTFGYFVQLGGMIDALITATTGAKSSIATTAEGEIKKILDTVTLSLEHIQEKQLELKSKMLKKFEADGVIDENERKEIDSIQYPVVVIDGFLSKEFIRESYIYNLLSNWAAELAENRIAHVVFVSENAASIQMLEKLLPTKFLEQINLEDASPSESEYFLKKRLGQHNIGEVERVSNILGGRLHDLELFAAKVKSGIAAPVAIDEMVRRAVAEIRKNGLTEKKHWTDIQFWKVVQELSKNSRVSFDQLVVHSLFNANPEPLLQLERAGLISILYENGRPFVIKPARPIYVKAFNEMLKDERYSNFMAMLTAKHFYSYYQKKVIDYENELRVLAEITDHEQGNMVFGMRSDPLLPRKEWLHTQIGYYAEKSELNFAEYEKYKKKLKLE